MEVGDWITLAAVIVALGIGVASILHTRSMQKVERRERILNEIIEWAIQSSECDVIPETSAWINANDTEKQRLFALGAVIIERNKIKETWGRSHYVQKAILPGWDNLNKAIINLTEQLSITVDLLDNSTDAVNANDIQKFGDNQIKLGNHKTNIYAAVANVIEEATKIKMEHIK